MLEKLPESVGHALINQRAGMEQVVYNHLFRLRSTARLDVRSPAFVFNAELPMRFTADGDGISPPLEWDEIPPETESLALLVEDADSPTPHPLVHAIVVDLPTTTMSLTEGALSEDESTSRLNIGQNSFLRNTWLPPDPPPGHGAHRYVFQVFALRGGDTIERAPGRGAFIALVEERAIGVGCLIGTYERTERNRIDRPVTEVEPAAWPQEPVTA